MHDLSIQGLEPLTEEKATHTDYITVTDVSDDLEELLYFAERYQLVKGCRNVH
jgi:hypothetical protein